MAARKIKTIAIDLGNIDIKGAMLDENGKLILKEFPNKVRTKKTLHPKAKALTKDGKTTYFGIGDLNNKSKKYNRNYLLEQVLVMTNELLPREEYVIVDLKLGLPPEQYWSDKALEDFKNNFEIDKEIKFRVGDDFERDDFKIVKFNSVKVYMEGYSAFKAVEAQGILKGKTKRIIGIDLGGGTCDVCDYEYDYDDECYYPNDPLTLENGLVDMAKEIATAINNANTNTVSPEQVEAALRNDLELIDNTYKLNDYKKAISHIENDMVTKIKDAYDLQTFETVEVLGLGGGFENFIKLTSGTMESDIEVSRELRKFGNAIGYLCQ